ELDSPDKKDIVVFQNFFASISSLNSNFVIEEELVEDFICLSVEYVAIKNPTLARSIVTELIRLTQSRRLARRLIKNLPINTTAAPAWFLVSKLLEECDLLISKFGG
ncbi:MAG: hypothetical protein ACK4SO_05355, partial [Candidatus Kapaibacteriota bacterium]